MNEVSHVMSDDLMQHKQGSSHESFAEKVKIIFESYLKSIDHGFSSKGCRLCFFSYFLFKRKMIL